MVKMILFGGVGDSSIPKKIQQEMNDKPFPENRCGRVVEYLESYPIITDNLAKAFESLKDGEVLRASENTFYFGGRFYPIRCNIIEIDETRPWAFDEYDGAEGILYLDGYKCVNEKMNYHEYEHGIE